MQLLSDHKEGSVVGESLGYAVMIISFLSHTLNPKLGIFESNLREKFGYLSNILNWFNRSTVIPGLGRITLQFTPRAKVFSKSGKESESQLIILLVERRKMRVSRTDTSIFSAFAYTTSFLGINMN